MSANEPSINEDAFRAVIEARMEIQSQRTSNMSFSDAMTTKLSLVGAMTTGYYELIRPVMEFFQAPILWTLTKEEPRFRRVIIHDINFLLVPGEFPRMLVTTKSEP